MMKINIIIYTVLFLAAASLGLAFPGKIPSAPVVAATKGLPSSPVTTNPSSPSPTKGPSKVPSSAGLDSITQVLNAAGAPDDIGSILKTITPKCQTTLLNIVVNPEFLKCIPIQSLVPLAPILTDPSILPKVLADPKTNYKLVEAPLNQFATLFCPAPKCSDKGIQDTIKAIQDGCAEDLKNKNKVIELIFGLTVLYSPIHDGICYKSTVSDKFCWDESVLNIIALPKSPIKIIDGGIIDSIAVADPPKICTKCNKGLVNIFFNFLENNDLAQQVLAGIGVSKAAIDLGKVGVAVKCGISFEDGKIP